MTDPISDMLTRIRNAYLAKKPKVQIPYSDIKHKLANKLVELGYIESVKVEGAGIERQLVVSLVYKNNLPVVTAIKRISKPGRRIYTSKTRIPRVLAGYGATILTTSKGLLTGKEAKTMGIGGEILCQIW